MVTAKSGRAVHQLLVSASPRDAVTNSVREIRALLGERYRSEAFALNRHPDVMDDFYSPFDYVPGRMEDPDPVTIVHISMGDSRFIPLMDKIPGQFVIMYHNVTPPGYFSKWDPTMARLLEEALDYAGALQSRSVLALADSSFNGEDLIAVGYDSFSVAGLITGRDRLLNVPPAKISAPEDIPVILSVGQLYPHKRPDYLIASLLQLRQRCGVRAHLVLAGAARLDSFSHAVARYVKRLGLEGDVTITGSISEEELVAWYRRADLFAVASEHEGFCVPLIEAMLFDVPIVARANAAIPETVGPAAVLVPSDTSPSAFARVMAEVLEDPVAARVLVERGMVQRERFSDDSARRRLLDALEPVLAGRDR